MKAVISKMDLVNLIGKIQSIVATKPTIPILSNVLIEAIDDQLIVSATDLTVSMRMYVEAKVVEEGSIALPAKRFFHLVRELTSPQIKIICLNEEVAEITSLSSHFKIHSNIDVDPSLQGSYILPLKAVEEMIKMLTDDLETVTLSLTHDKIFL